MANNKIPTIDITPQISDLDATQEDQKRITEQLLITSNTPDGQDPLIFWYHCAKDALDTINKLKEKKSQDDQELINLRNEKCIYNRREKRQLEWNSMPPVRDLISDVKRGQFSMTMSVTLTPYTIDKGCDSYDQEE